MKHVALSVEGSDPPGKQPVEDEECEDGAFRVLRSPGFVEGIAAEDRIVVTNHELGLFEVVEHGGNVALKWATRDPIEGLLNEANRALRDIGARFDGAMKFSAVWTVSASAGFPDIESRMARLVELSDDSEWWYGNVYDENGTPLGWWDGA